MKVEIHTLFQYLLDTTTAQPEAIVGLSLSRSPTLGDFLADLDPALPLDWNGRSFLGLPELRRHVVAQAGLTDPDNVLITAGAAEANYLAIRQLVGPGDGIVTETPGWPQAAVLARAIGAELTVVQRRESDGWALPLDDLARAITPKTKLIFLSNPNNPTGQLLTAADLHAIAAMADRVGAWLLVDEVYAGLEWTGPRAPSIAGIYPRGITTGSVSKALGLQGLRTGWMICRDKGMIRDAYVLRENSSEIMSILGEVIAEIALRPARVGPALATARAQGQANLDLLDQFIAAQPLSWVRPMAGLIGLTRLPDGITSEPFAKRLLGPPYNTFLIPGHAYDQPQHIRLGVGGGAEVNLGMGLERVGLLLAAWDRSRGVTPE
jgi:aspartate/methionine/tyrosine aminotransferase